MDGCRFILFGENKDELLLLKQVLCKSGHIFIGYLREKNSVLRSLRLHQPDFVVFDLMMGFSAYREIVEVIDEDLLAACILYTSVKTNEMFGFLKRARAASILMKPSAEDAITQVVDNAILQHRRIINMDHQVRSLNEKLDTRLIIEKAKWLIVAKDNVSENEAYEQIRKRSRDKRVTMKEMAEAILIAFGN